MCASQEVEDICAVPSRSATCSDPTADGSLDPVSGSEDPEQTCQSMAVSQEEIVTPLPVAEVSVCFADPAEEAGGRSVLPAVESEMESDISHPWMESCAARLTFRPIPLPRGVAVTAPPPCAAAKAVDA